MAKKMKFYALWISLVCIAMFFLQQIEGFTEIFLLNRGAFTQIWRFLTAIFLHGSLSHLTLNLFGIIFFGLILEKLVGSKKFLYIFFLSGIFANLVSVFFYHSSLGASGAVFGIIGALTIIKPFTPVFAFGLILPISVASIFWIVGDILRELYAETGVGHIAHLSGIGIGILFGIYIRSKKGKDGGNSKKGYKSEKPEISEKTIRDWEEKNMLYFVDN